jgi:trehalose/maltose hydrolase-like predicted phosphorylase
LSRLVHAYLAHITDQHELSWKLYQEALRSDFMDIQGGTTREGIHLGVMAGTIRFVYQAYAGINWNGQTLTLNPRLPAGWSALEFKLNFQGGSYHFVIQQKKVRAKLLTSGEKSILINDSFLNLPEGEWVETKYIR